MGLFRFSNSHVLVWVCFLDPLGNVERPGLQLIRHGYVPLHDILRRCTDS